MISREEAEIEEKLAYILNQSMEQGTMQDGVVEIQKLAEKYQAFSWVNPAMRFLDCCFQGCWGDACGHLRQILVYFPGIDLELPDEVVEAMKANKASDSRLTFQPLTNGFIRPDLMDGSTEILPERLELKLNYVFEKKRQTTPSLGDGELYRFTGYTQYRSMGQKLLMYLLRNQKSKETILACLPTGGGKSLAWQLPAASDFWGGTAIVVMPTTALVLDQYHSSLKYEKKLPFYHRHAVAWDPGQMDKYEKYKRRMELFHDIERGKISTLYISPESLQQKEFTQTSHMGNSLCAL